ncbi:MAG: carbamoyltransferase HypF [Pseudomonadota bacterium]
MLISVRGVVQGVGFRPFVYRLAARHGLTGSVANTLAGVEIDVEGPAHELVAFERGLVEEAPPLAAISGVSRREAEPRHPEGFIIEESVASGGDWQPVAPDSCTCPDCLSEMRDPLDRRYRYPFINCTNCGPRFTIIDALPYDRPATSMSAFGMCPACSAEYEDPLDRRFHAEPNACPDCGPSLRLVRTGGEAVACGDPLLEAARLLGGGAIVAVKGLGGFQLACPAGDEAAVLRLRERKRRPDKPFAVMVAEVADAVGLCRVSDREREALESPQRPIVLLERDVGAGHGSLGIAGSVAPGLGRLGVMLPAAPIHFLLMEAVGTPLVMTSGNLSEEPICGGNSEALRRLGSVADYFLLHDRGIRAVYDDSVVAFLGDRMAMIRRARGYAPLPVPLAAGGSPSRLLAAGAGLKNTFCLARDGQAFVSQHMGDLEDAATLEHFEHTVSAHERLFGVDPERIACDLHPDYLSSVYAAERARELDGAGGADVADRLVRVQHHAAHVAACLAENGFAGEAVGVALDGTGLGEDGTIWGGEFLTGSLSGGFSRPAHLACMPLPGGDAAVREPWRAALGAVARFSPGDVPYACERLGLDNERASLCITQIESGINCPESSGCGRLFDAAAVLVTGRSRASYEAQAAMELEALAARHLRACGGGAAGSGGYTFTLDDSREPWAVSPAPAIGSLIDDLRAGVDAGLVALRFHQAAAEAIVRVTAKLARRSGLSAAALSGGVFQNLLLAGLVEEGLAAAGIDVLTHRELPPNDGCISYGQAAIALNGGHR